MATTPDIEELKKAVAQPGRFRIDDEKRITALIDAYEAMKARAEAAECCIAKYQDYAAQKSNEKVEAIRRAEAAEARVAELTEALREARDAAHDLAHDNFDGVWLETDFARLTPLADAALAGKENG